MIAFLHFFFKFVFTHLKPGYIIYSDYSYYSIMPFTTGLYLPPKVQNIRDVKLFIACTTV